jgi:type I restriction enzyme S subunit
MIRPVSKRYDAYWDTDVEWIGNTPAHWEITRNKDIFEERGTLSILGDETLLTVSHITGVTRRSEKNVNMFMAETMEGYKLCKTGDLIINTMWAWMGALGTAKEDGICSPAYGVYKPKKYKPYSYRYFDYLYRIPNAIIEMTRNSKGIVSSRLRLYPKDFFQIRTALPPDHEQNAIADYLDDKTAKIDQQIDLLTQKAKHYGELKQALINETVTRGLDKSVPMKDSGIDWIGEIPAHWEILPLKDLAAKKTSSFVDGPFGSDLKSDEYTDTGIPLIQLNNIGIGVHLTQNRKFISDSKALSLSKHCAYPGEIAIAKMAEPVARATVISEEFPMYVIVADCMKLKPNSNIAHAKFISYALNTIGVKSQAEILSNGTTRIRINLGTTKILKIVTPPLSEQKTIADYLDEKTAQIDTIVEAINAQIDKLKELRKTLINDVVTGKICIL